MLEENETSSDVFEDFIIANGNIRADLVENVKIYMKSMQVGRKVEKSSILTSPWNKKFENDQNWQIPLGKCSTMLIFGYFCFKMRIKALG